MKKSRRAFLKNASAITLGFTGLQSFIGGCANAKNVKLSTPHLIKDPLRILDLADGFNYRVISRAGSEMSDGFTVPARPDGMATFAAENDLTIIIRNHEVDIQPGTGAYGVDNERFGMINPDLLYDKGYGKSPSLGGTTTIVYDTKMIVLPTRRVAGISPPS